ncbi:uncharacterized protein LOC143298240 [Babylonia areolata]|uniref:uncharacterized protein LOC143298240 n=1 Tax=Babylonia areolata TaxID=304850 RepID=UPI003FD52A83
MAKEANKETELSTGAKMMKTIADFWRNLFVSETVVSRNSSLTVTSPLDGSTVTAYRDELERNGKLQKAVHRLEHTTSSADPCQKTTVFERRYPETDCVDPRTTENYGQRTEPGQGSGGVSGRCVCVRRPEHQTGGRCSEGCDLHSP